MRGLHYRISTTEASTVYLAQAMFGTYRNDLSDIKRLVTAIGLQHDLTTVICCFIYVREPSGGHRMFADEINVVWAEPTAARWQGRSEVLGHLCVILGEGYAARFRGR